MFNLFKKSNTECIFEKDFLPIGEDFECIKNQKKQRRDVIKGMNLNSSVRIENGKLGKAKVFLVVDEKSKLDYGILGEGAANMVREVLNDNSHAHIEAKICEQACGTYRVRVSIYK